MAGKFNQQTVPIGLVETPFHARLEALSTAKSWTGWDGYISPIVLDSVETEYFAIRNQSTLYDISPMRKYQITGAQAEPMLNRLVTRDVSKIHDGRVGYAVWCDEEGMVIDDGTIFRLSSTKFTLCCQERMFSWLHDAAFGFDVSITDITDLTAALALQGPTSFSLLSDAGYGEIADLRPFEFRRISADLTISRTGFTGDLGYELWTPHRGALDLWDRLWQAGQNWGLRVIGGDALNLARIEAGFIAAGTDFQPSLTASRPHRGRSPIELGFSKLVDFDKGHFNGRRALLKQQQTGQRFALVKIDIGGFKPANGSLIYHHKKKEVGHVTSGIWSPTTKRNIALAELKAPYGLSIKDDLWTEIYVNREGQWDRRVVPVSVVEGPFFSHPRSRATPPLPY